MEQFFSIVFGLTLALPISGFAQGTPKKRTVDVRRAFDEYTRKKKADVKLNDARIAAQKEFTDRADAYQKVLDEIHNLNKQLESPALNAKKKTQAAKERDDKIANIKNMEREINDFRQTRERQLQEQAMRMRENIVKEISDVIMERVKASGYDLVFDKSGQSTNFIAVLMYSKDSMDFTTDVITALNKRPVSTTTTEKPATSPATTTTTASPAASPK